ncbi:aspartate/glutamate racemase family protein [Elioraea sp.]|uniref:aspartate/glutamate racemase family protein n=1 Tax=Elioraea sp. TaxID=2185103 RepID=UPI003F71C9C9
MRLLLINGNTDAALTARMVAFARAAAGAAAIEGATARFGARYISTRSAAAIAGHAVLDALAHALAAGPAPDAVMLACFGDPGIAALRELSPVPVIGMAEASILTAATLGGRIALLTGGARWVPMLGEYAAAIGFGGRVAVRGIALTGDAVAEDPDAALPALAAEARAAVDRDGAEVVVLGGAGLAGLAGRIAADVPVPVLDSLDCTVRVAVALARAAAPKPTVGSYAAPPPVPVAGLSGPLAGLLLAPAMTSAGA